MSDSIALSHLLKSKQNIVVSFDAVTHWQHFGPRQSCEAFKHLIGASHFPSHTTTRTLMMKQQNKMIYCPSVALGLFIALVLYDHRRAIARSQMISSKRRWVKGKKKGGGGGGQQMMNKNKALWLVVNWWLK